MNTGNLENKDLPAFACVGYDALGGGYQQDGLTKREYFAAMAMQAFAINSDLFKPTKSDWQEYKKTIASASVDLADAVIQKLCEATD